MLEAANPLSGTVPHSTLNTMSFLRQRVSQYRLRAANRQHLRHTHNHLPGCLSLTALRFALLQADILLHANERGDQRRVPTIHMDQSLRRDSCCLCRN